VRRGNLENSNGARWPTSRRRTEPRLLSIADHRWSAAGSTRACQTGRRALVRAPPGPKPPPGAARPAFGGRGGGRTLRGRPPHGVDGLPPCNGPSRAPCLALTTTEGRRRLAPSAWRPVHPSPGLVRLLSGVQVGGPPRAGSPPLLPPGGGHRRNRWAIKSSHRRPPWGGEPLPLPGEERLTLDALNSLVRKVRTPYAFTAYLIIERHAGTKRNPRLSRTGGRTAKRGDHSDGVTSSFGGTYTRRPRARSRSRILFISSSSGVPPTTATSLPSTVTTTLSPRATARP